MGEGEEVSKEKNITIEMRQKLFWLLLIVQCTLIEMYFIT